LNMEYEALSIIALAGIVVLALIRTQFGKN